MYVLENMIPHVLNEDTDNKAMIDYWCHIDDDEQVIYVMLTWTSNITWEYGCPYNNCTYQRVIWCN